MSQDTKGISFSIKEETFAFAIQSLVNNTMTWHRRNAPFGTNPTSADQDFALRNLQAKVYQAIYEEGTKWTPPDAQAGTPAEVDDTAEKFEICTSSSGSAAQHGTGIWAPPSPHDRRLCAPGTVASPAVRLPRIAVDPAVWPLQKMSAHHIIIIVVHFSLRIYGQLALKSEPVL
eukprot:2200962-Pyramimonas_sp.AAC.1